jgi:hypothetical protein
MWSSFRSLYDYFVRKGHTFVVTTAREIVQQSEEYFDTILGSIEVAKTGCQLAGEAELFGERLAAASLYPQDFRNLSASVLELARKISEQSQEAEASFGRVCTGFVQVIHPPSSF